ncbi:MAG: hypothetical protein AAF560_26890 [Acidobacteriota bacterium]
MLESIHRVVVAGEQHAASSARIGQSMRAITEVAAGTVRRNDNIAKASEDLGELLDDLRQRIARFKVRQPSPAS